MTQIRGRWPARYVTRPKRQSPDPFADSDLPYRDVSLVDSAELTLRGGMYWISDPCVISGKASVPGGRGGIR